MTLYKATCAYRDLDGEIYTACKVVEADSKQEAKNILDNYFYNKYNHLVKDCLLFSTTKEVNTNTTISHGKGSISIGGSANDTVIQTGKHNININSANRFHIGDY